MRKYEDSMYTFLEAVKDCGMIDVEMQHVLAYLEDVPEATVYTWALEAEKSGYINKSRHPGDARKRVYSLTDAGEDYLGMNDNSPIEEYLNKTQGTTVGYAEASAPSRDSYQLYKFHVLFEEELTPEEHLVLATSLKRAIGILEDKTGIDIDNSDIDNINIEFLEVLIP